MSSQPKKAKSNQSKEAKVPTLQERLAHAQAETERWKRLSLQPGLSPKALLAARELATSWQAAADLGEKALQHEVATKGPQTLSGDQAQPEQPQAISPLAQAQTTNPQTSSMISPET